MIANTVAASKHIRGLGSETTALEVLTPTSSADAGLAQAAVVEEATGEEPPAEPPAPVMSKEEKAAAARERYLARKRKAPA